MAHDPKFGPAAQTPEQRAHVLAQLQRALPTARKKVDATTQHLYDRYIAGELSWTQVQEAREATTRPGGRQA